MADRAEAKALKQTGETLYGGVEAVPAAKATLSVQRRHELKRDSQAATFGETFVRSGDSLAQLSRYETSMERSLFKSLHELQRLQAARRGKEVPVPLALDIDVSHADTPERPNLGEPRLAPE